MFAEPEPYPVRVVVTARADVTPGVIPDTVTRPLPLMVTVPLAVALPDHVYAAS
jgi:hypothetical protein